MSAIHKPNIFVFTGGSSSGKSSIIAELRGRGHTCIPEAGRIVVQKEQAAGGDGLPWVNLARFRDRIFEKSVEAFKATEETVEPVFFDRSFLEALSCSHALGITPPQEHLQAVRDLRFNQTVFITPPWQEIFTNDAERKTTFEAAVKDYEMNRRVYAEAGYDLAEVPKGSVGERAEFVLGVVRAQG